MSQLERYTELAKAKSTSALAYAIQDIKNAWEANPDFQEVGDPYADKLWAEFDAYTVEMQRRFGDPTVCPECGRV
jgi:hypothetical protein